MTNGIIGVVAPCSFQNTMVNLATGCMSRPHSLNTEDGCVCQLSLNQNRESKKTVTCNGMVNIALLYYFCRLSFHTS